MKRKLFLLLCALLTMIGAQAQETPTNDGIYYLYNSETDLFLSRGNDWGTQAVANPVALPWKVSINGGNYTLRMYDLTVAGSTTGFGSNGFTDNGSPIQFTPSGNATDGFTLKNGNNYITCPASAGVVTLSTTASAWKFLTQAQYNAVLAARVAAQESAVAAAKGIVIPAGKTLNDVVSDADNWASTFTNDGVPTSGKWTASKHGSRGGNLNWGNYGSEMYQCGDGHYTRTISGLKKGIYKVTIRGMKRMGNNETCTTMGNAGYPVSDTYLTANGNVIRFKAWYEDRVSDSNPNSTGDFVNIVNNGGYTTEGFAYVGDDGNLVLDASSEAYWGGSWFLFNGISYTFYNNEVSDEDAAEIIATAESTLEKKMGDLYSQAISDAKTTFEAAKTIANYNALNTAISNAAVSIASYATIAAGSVPDDKLDGWVCENTNTFHINTWSTEGNSDGSNMKTPFIENWVGKGSYLGAGKVYYQLQGLNPGEVYYAQALVRSYNEASADAPNGPNFFINDKVVNMTEEGTTFTYNNMSGIYATLGGAATVGEDGVLKLGVEIANDRNYNWVAFKSISIRPMQDALDAAREAANAQVGKKMNNDVAHALALALETYGTGTPTTAEEYEVAITALSNATIAAENSVAYYQEAATILNAASSLDAAGQASYTTNETVVAIQSTYNDGTLVSVTSEQKATCATALRTAAKAQTTPGADMTLAIINPSFETGNLEGWTSTDGGATANNNNWPAGKNGTYYVERWQPATDGSLSDGSLLQTINDLPAGRYRLTVNAQNIEQGNGGAHGTGYILKAGDKQAVVSESVENSVEITLQSAGNLEIGMVLENCTGNWISCDHFRLTYVASPVDPTPYREAVASKLTTAQGLVNEVMNANVETDLNNAIAATAGYEESFDIAALEQMAADLDAANAAAQTSVANYQEAAAVLNAAATAGLDAAGQAAYAANETVLEIKAGYDNKTLVAVTDEQKTLCQAALKTAVKAQTTDGADWTLLIENPGFEGSYISIANPSPNRDIYQPEGWTAVWDGDTNDMTSLNSSCTQWNDNFKDMPQPADGGNNVYWARYRWGNQSSLTLKQTIPGLPAGVYEVGAEGYLSNATNGTATLSVKFGDEVAIVDFTAAEWTTKTVAFAINEEQDVEILYNLTENAQVEIKAGVDNFTLTARSAASTEDYAALNAAIETAEGKTLGFEDGEYAPYNNTEALKALADAKAINQSVVNTKSFVQGATAALTGATWSANAEELNAVWDGSFNYDYRATTPSGNVNPYGWQRVKDAAADGYNVRYMDGSNAGLAATSSGKALFTKQSAYYGYEDGYTMPLKANTVYKVTFVYGGWGDCKNDGYVSMTDPNGNAVTLSATDLPVDATDADANPESWKTYTAYFTTGEAGNYVLGLRKKNYDTSGQSQYVYGDIVLKKSEGVNLKVADGKLGTFVAPFDVTLPAGVKGYRVASVTETEIKLALIAVGGNELTAGTPLIVYGDGADVDETFYGIPTETENVKAGSLYGILDVNNTTVPADAYVLQTQGGVQAFYKVAADAPGALNRCYVIAASPNARLVITFDGEDPTAINAIEAAEAEDGALKDGKYFIDGKVILVKNGVKYGANGQILK